MATDAQKTFLIVLFFISLITHFLFFYCFFYPNPCLLSFDSAHYHEMALALKNNFCFCASDGTPFFYRLPGYPIFLAGIYSILGINPYYVIGVQLVLASILPVLVFFLSIRLQGVIPACAGIQAKPSFQSTLNNNYLAAIMTAIHPAFFIFPCMIMSEIVFVFLFMIFLIIFMYGLKTYFKPTLPFLAGLVLGVISLIRPLGLPLVLASIFLTCLYPGLTVFCRFLKNFMLFVGWVVVVGIWLLRNFLLTGTLFLHTFSGPHLLNHGATRIIMETQNISYEKAKELVQKELEIIQKESYVNRSRLQEKYAWDIMMCYPSTTIKFFIKNSIKTTISLYSAELLFVDSGGALPPYDNKRSMYDMVKRFLLPTVHNKAIPFVIYYELAYMIFLFVGFVLFAITHNIFWKKIFMLTYIVLFIGMSCVCGFARLRLPIEPLLIVGAAYFYSRTASKFPDS